MKNTFAWLAVTALISLNVASASQSTLVCHDSAGRTLEWSPHFGELTLKSASGKVLEDQDALIESNPRYYETFPVKKVTDIIYGDEDSSPVIAEVTRMGTSARIEMDGTTYDCQ